MSIFYKKLQSGYKNPTKIAKLHFGKIRKERITINVRINKKNRARENYSYFRSRFIFLDLIKNKTKQEKIGYNYVVGKLLTIIKLLVKPYSYQAEDKINDVFEMMINEFRNPNGIYSWNLFRKKAYEICKKYNFREIELHEESEESEEINIIDYFTPIEFKIVNLIYFSSKTREDIMKIENITQWKYDETMKKIKEKLNGQTR